MLELIRHWLVGITCAAMLVALAESLIPAGSIRRIARLTGVLVLLSAILNPLLKLDTTALTRALTEYKLELSAYSADLEEENEILMKDIIEEQSGAYIQDKAAALGIDCQVTVEADGEEEWPIPQSVTVMGSLTAEQQEELERKLEQALAQIDGVGEVRVVLTLQSGPRRILAQDSQSTVDEGRTEAEVTNVVISASSGVEGTVTLQQLSPQFQGALVVCSGGGEPTVQLRLVEAVSALTGLGADKISVCKGK